MQNKIKPFTIIKKKNRSIGIIGVILEGVPVGASVHLNYHAIVTFYLHFQNLTSTGKLTFRNESEAIMEAARELKEEDLEINIIIVVSHVGFEVDKIIAEHTGSEVDIIVGGHSHTFLYTGIPPGPKEPEDNYPYVYKHSSGNKVLIVQAACHAKYVGNLTVFFDKAGKVAKYEGAPIYMDSEVSKDEDVVKAMEPWKKLFDEKSKLVVGKTKVDLLREPCRLGECRLGNFFTDAVIEAFGDKNNCTSDKGNWTTTPIALVNAGALRISLDKGDLHYADVVTMSPFTNMIIAYDIPGAQLKKALEFSVATQNIDERRRFLQVSGLKVTYNSSREMNNRVVDLEIRTNACPYPQYEKFDEKKIYRIASPSFLQGGGDGFHMLPEKATNLHNQLIDLDALLNYLKKHEEIEPKLENRIKIVH
uniref:5'-Nucleotidase C-terminal domain-containing protein n=1 Tax=Glossina brevipalpis TaxID=37001 RepID=A0A1A9WZF2_9MUSC